MIHIMSHIPSTLSSVLIRFSASSVLRLKILSLSSILHFSASSVLRLEILSLSSILRFSPRFVAIRIINLNGGKYEKIRKMREYMRKRRKYMRKKEEIYEKKGK
jgi:hypothetical protein